MNVLARELATAEINDALTIAAGGVTFMLVSYFAYSKWQERGLPYWLWYVLNGVLGLAMHQAFPYFGLGYLGMSIVRLFYAWQEESGVEWGVL